jgi:hypothetical protein
LEENQFEREDHYITSLKPEYNILQKAGSSVGFKHSEETRNKMKGRKHPNTQIIEVLDLYTNEKSYYNSMLAASKALNIHPATISNYLSRNQTKPFKDRYIFKKVD